MLDKIKKILSRTPQDEAQLIDILHAAQQQQLLDAEALQMIESILAVSDMHARDIMIPRPQMTVVDANESLETVIPTIIESRHSRFPVIGESRDKVLGILLAKDLLPAVANKKKHHSLRDFIRPATFIPESKRLDVLLKEFRLNRNHMAIVVDEYGGVAGLVTIEDVLEQIVGDIEDEYDINEKKNFIQKLQKGEYLVNALTPIELFNNHFHTNFAKTDFDTFGGLILQQFGYLPKRNEVTQLDRFQVTIVKASRRGIKLLRVKQLLPKI